MRFVFAPVDPNRIWFYFIKASDVPGVKEYFLNERNTYATGVLFFLCFNWMGEGGVEAHPKHQLRAKVTAFN